MSPCIRPQVVLQFYFPSSSTSSAIGSWCGLVWRDHAWESLVAAPQLRHVCAIHCCCKVIQVF
jgi:hypothetical protein